MAKQSPVRKRAAPIIDDADVQSLADVICKHTLRDGI